MLASVLSSPASSETAQPVSHSSVQSETLPEMAALSRVLTRQRRAFAQNPMPSAAQRIEWLKALREMLKNQQEALVQAIGQDFGNRSADETRLAEIMPSILGIRHACAHVKKWMKPERRSVGIAFQPASARVLYQPLGVIGVIVPWNYPLMLAIGPLVGALSAGNRVMLKISEYTPATGQLLKKLLADIFPEDLVAVVLGEAEVGKAFSRLPFDHLLFTGSTEVGKQVMRAAADNLTPITLELGGKSPAIVSSSMPMEEAARRIAFGKSLNSGQTCIAPDYVLVPRAQQNEFVQAYQQVIQTFFPTMADNPDYSSIINERQFERLQVILAEAQSKGAQVIRLFDKADDRRMAHALILGANDSMRLMQEEIFGPLLPIVPYEHLDEAIAYINARPRPLALYYFGYDKQGQQKVLNNTHSGGVGLNECLLHIVQDDMPFGGIGPSGMGHYHGREGFLTFSKAKAVFSRGRFNATRFIYPPYGKPLQKLIYKLFIR